MLRTPAGKPPAHLFFTYYRKNGEDADAAGEVQEYDPSNHALAGPYTALFLDYVRRELRWESDLPYYTSGQVQPWDYAPYANRYLNMVEELRSAMARNPFLKVMVANGYYDFATPFGATEYTIDHLGGVRSAPWHLARAGSPAAGSQRRYAGGVGEADALIVPLAAATDGASPARRSNP